jgi:hypothetical protein
MRRSKNRIVLQIEAMETKLVLSALAPVAAARVAAGHAADVERAVATPMMAHGRNTNFIMNNTNGLFIHVFETLHGETVDWKIHNGKAVEFRFKSNAPGFIKARIMVADGGQGPKPFHVDLNQTNDGYFGKTFTVSRLGNSFTVST